MHILEKIVELYAPHCCVGCGDVGSLACTACLCGLPKARAECYACRSVTPASMTCRDCSPAGVQQVLAACKYAGVAKDIVWQLKFGRAAQAAEDMARPMSVVCRRRLATDALLVPAPTARVRVRQRGYDQAVLLTKAIARRTGLPYCQALNRYGRQRQLGADRAVRRQQLIEAFKVCAPAAVRGRHIVLVDDVVTTGSTLESAAHALLKAGAASVSALVFASA